MQSNVCVFETEEEKIGIKWGNRLNKNLVCCVVLCNSVIMNTKWFIVLSIFFTAIEGQTCKWRDNYIYFKINGIEKVTGISPTDVPICLRKAMTVYENTVSGLHYEDMKDNPGEDVKLLIIFENFKQKYPSSVLENEISFTHNNCTGFADVDDDNIDVIYNGEIHFNTNYNFHCKHTNIEHLTPIGIDLFSRMLHENGKLVGLKYNNDPSSIMFRLTDNFDYYQDNGHLNENDRKRINKLYFLEKIPKPL